jgi:hypothetical protein
MYETLLFLHVLSAFVLMAGVVALSATALGVPVGAGPFTLGSRLVEIGGTGVLIFGLWIVFREDFYDLTDGWILGAIGLWIVSTGMGTMSTRGVGEGSDPRFEGRAAAMHWVATAAALGILVLMVWKPGA